jgi:hypothetical protein
MGQDVFPADFDEQCGNGVMVEPLSHRQTKGGSIPHADLLKSVARRIAHLSSFGSP